LKTDSGGEPGRVSGLIPWTQKANKEKKTHPKGRGRIDGGRRGANWGGINWRRPRKKMWKRSSIDIQK